MTKPFIDEVIELCTLRGYQVQAVGISGEQVEITFSTSQDMKPVSVDELQMCFEELV